MDRPLSGGLARHFPVPGSYVLEYDQFGMTYHRCYGKIRL